MKIQEIKFKGLPNSYSVLIGNKTLNLLPKKIRSLCPNAKKIALLSDRNVPNKFKSIIQKPAIQSKRRRANNRLVQTRDRN